MVDGAAFGHSSQNLHSQQGLDWRASSARSSGSLGGYGFSQSQATANANHSSNYNGGTGISKINSFFGGKPSNRDLPVYKDKPYFKPRRTGSDKTKARVIYVMIALFVTTMLYVFWGGWGSVADIGPSGNVGEELWKWVQTLDEEETSTSKYVDWAERRERVRDAFIVSWDSYETYGWGKPEILNILVSVLRSIYRL
jgi:mannosyl-oligosaccharide alpha-1,2-mannosidase